MRSSSSGVPKNTTIRRSECSKPPRASISSSTGVSSGPGMKVAVTPSLVIVSSSARGLELGVVHQDAAGAADQVRVERLEPARPLDRVEVEVDVVGGDRRDAGPERVEVVQVVGDHGLPRAIGLDPRLRVAGGPRRQLQEARRVLVDVQQRVVGRAARLQLAERDRPVGHVRADRREHAHGLELAAAGLDDSVEPRVEDERLRLDVVERPGVRLGRDVGVEHGAHEVVLLEAEPRLDDLGRVEGEHAHAVAALEAGRQQARTDPVRARVELAEAEGGIPARQGRGGPVPLGGEP